MLRKSRNESGDEFMITEMPNPVAGRRQERLSAQIQRELSDLIRREASDPRLSRITITGVEMAEDGGAAKVKLCRMMEGECEEPSEEQKRELMKGVRSASKFFFSSLKKRIPVRYLPHLFYEYDDSIQKSSEVWQILSRLSEKERANESST